MLIKWNSPLQKIFKSSHVIFVILRMRRTESLDDLSPGRGLFVMIFCACVNVTLLLLNLLVKAESHGVCALPGELHRE